MYFPLFFEGVTFIRKAVKFIFDVISSCIKDGINSWSAHAAFFVTVSFIPFIMLMISMVRFFPVGEAEVLGQISSVFPKGARDMVSSLITESYSKSGTALISITAVTTLWAASIGVFSLVRGLNRVFNTNETRNFIVVRLVSMFYTLFLMILFILCLTVFVFGDTLSEWLSWLLPWFFDVALVIQSLRLIVGTAVLTLFFAVMYKVVPNRKAKFFTELPGALVSSIGWVGFSYIFSYYYENIANFSYVYGSLSVIVFFMLWLYICLYILFVGAEINKYIEDNAEKALLLK